MANSELELAMEKIARLEQQLLTVYDQLGREEIPLKVLPNGDLHRGMRLKPISEENVAHYPIEAQHPLNKAMAAILKEAKGSASLTCLWCGQQFDSQNAEEAIRNHLKAQHPSVVTPTDDAKILMHNLAEAEKALAEK